jgi:RES domain
VTTKHPDPPADPASLRLLIQRVSYGGCRIHSVHHGPVFFGASPMNRFDAPAGEFGVLYLGKDAHCAFIETFGHETGRTPFVTETELRARAVSFVHTRRPLRLADLRAEGLARMGADAELTTGSDYELSRRWALAIHNHPRAPDGILYRARHDPARTSLALFDRAEKDIVAVPAGTLLEPKHAGLLASILDTYGYGLVP